MLTTGSTTAQRWPQEATEPPKDAPEMPKSFNNLRKINQNRVWGLFVPPRRGPKSRLLRPSWAAFGALLVGGQGGVESMGGIPDMGCTPRLEPLLGPFRSPLSPYGSLWGPFGPV